MNIKESSDITYNTLYSLIHSLKLQGYNLSEIKDQYLSNIISGAITAANPTYKEKYIEILENIIQELENQ